MMPSSVMIRRIGNPEQGTHSNPKCACFRARNDGIIRVYQTLI